MARKMNTEDVRCAIAAARERYSAGNTDSIEIDFDEAQRNYGGADPDLAADIERSVRQFWDQ